MKFEPKSYVIHEINSKQSKDLTIRSEDVNLLENTTKKLLDISLGNEFLAMTPRGAKANTQVGLHETEKLMITSLLFPLSRN